MVDLHSTSFVGRTIEVDLAGLVNCGTTDPIVLETHGLSGFVRRG
jgi:hypothetical protein